MLQAGGFFAASGGEAEVSRRRWLGCDLLASAERPSSQR